MASVASVTVSPDSSDVAPGGTLQLSATVKDASGNTLSGRVVTWSSSDPATASVSSSGVVTALAAGRAAITATSEGKSGTAVVRAVATIDTLSGVTTERAVKVIPLRVAPFDPANYAPGAPGLGTLPVSFNTVIVIVAADATLGQLNQLLRDFEARLVGGVPNVQGAADGIVVLRLPSRTHAELASLLVALRQRPIVHGVSLDTRLSVTTIPQPPTHSLLFPLDWSVTPNSGNWGLEAVRAPQMWNFNDAIRKAGRTTKTGVLDNGFAHHTGLVYDEVVAAFDDTASHGTHVAGIIGATFDDGVGTDGITPFARLVVKGGAFSASYLVTDFATFLFERPALRVINLSLGYNWGSHGVDTRTDASAQSVADGDGRCVATILAAFATNPNFSLPVIVAAAGNDSNLFPNQDARYASPFANASLTQHAAPIVVVEALENDFTTGTQSRADYSNHGGQLSAPGSAILSTVPQPSNDYDMKNGTSQAAPFVTGLVSYLYALDPTLPAPTMTSNTIRDLLVRTATAVSGAAPMINAFAAAMDVDRVRGTDAALRALVDMDDGTHDGNVRVGPDEAKTDADGDGGRGDGSIDMADFRRWRDALLQVEGAAGTTLNGPAIHPKRDLNGDRRVDAAALENVFPRGDLNGDGRLSRTVKAQGWGVLQGRQVTDLEVLQERFQDPDYHAADLPSLIDSGDLTIRPLKCLTIAGVASVRSTVTSHGPVVVQEARNHTLTDSTKIYTVVVAAAAYTARVEALNASGTVLGGAEEDFTVTRGSDAEWDPVCLGVSLSAPFPTTVTVGTPTPLTITAGERDPATGAITLKAGIAISVTVTGGTVSQASGATNAAGQFSTNATLSAGQTAMTIVITARLANGMTGKLTVVAFRPTLTPEGTYAGTFTLDDRFTGQPTVRQYSMRLRRMDLNSNYCLSIVGFANGTCTGLPNASQWEGQLNGNVFTATRTLCEGPFPCQPFTSTVTATFTGNDIAVTGVIFNGPFTFNGTRIP